MKAISDTCPIVALTAKSLGARLLLDGQKPAITPNGTFHHGVRKNMYRCKNTKLQNLFSMHESINMAKVHEHHRDSVEILKAEVEAHYSIMNETAFLMGRNAFVTERKAEAAILSCIHKGFFLYYSVLDLSTKGLYGPGRALLRSIYEALVIAKFCAVDKSGALHKKWEDQQYVNLNADVFNKIKGSDTDEMRLFWKGLHELTHATTCSQQITLDFEVIENEILHNLSLVQVLLSCTYHLISRHWLTSSIIYYTSRYGQTSKLTEARQVAREISQNNRSNFTNSGKRLLRQYCATWEVAKPDQRVQRFNR